MINLHATTFVIPAEAGIQEIVKNRTEFYCNIGTKAWIPAFAGMTGVARIEYLLTCKAYNVRVTAPKQSHPELDSGSTTV